jgi:uncharacterized spore protein YtfJ
MSNLPVQLADTIKSFGVKAVYGDAVDIEGTTVVPVAVMAYGFGGGGGSGDEGQGEGGGGGGYTLPIGAYVGDSLGVRFQPNVIAVLTVGIPFAYAVGTALSRIIKALKK